MNFRTPAWVVQLTVWLINISSDVFNKAYQYLELLKKITTLLSSDEIYMFLQDSPFPYTFTESSTAISAKPALLYNSTKKIFQPWSECLTKEQVLQIGTQESLPILSLEVIDSKDTVLYDLTNFIESIRYVKSMPSYPKPSIGHILSVWQLNQRIILDHNLVSARYINQEADTKTVSIRDISNIYLT
jgi:hypothetical protein